MKVPNSIVPYIKRTIPVFVLNNIIKISEHQKNNNRKVTEGKVVAVTATFVTLKTSKYTTSVNLYKFISGEARLEI